MPAERCTSDWEGPLSVRTARRVRAYSDSAGPLRVRLKRRSQYHDCDATATRNKHVHFYASLHEVAAAHDAGIGAGVVDRPCNFHVFRLINDDNLLLAVTYFYSIASISYAVELE